MDYTTYRFTGKEMAEQVVIYLLLDACISYLFFRSVTVMVMGMGLFPWFLREVSGNYCKKRREVLTGQFLSAMNAVITSLTAGYSVETAFEDAGKELETMFDENAPIIREMRAINNQLKMNRNLEDLLRDFSDRSGIEDIRNFAEVFAISKRSGGNLIAIIRYTAKGIAKKEETKKEIQANLSAKKLEANIMSTIPCLILIYVQLMSPGFLDGMYHNVTGIVIMGSSLAVYAAAVIWGRKIVEIDI